MVGKLRRAHPKLKMLIVADGLYAKQPLLEVLNDARMP
jgi:hypothetical protein